MAPAVFDTQTYGRRLREPRIKLRSIRGSCLRRHPYRQCVLEVNAWLIVWFFLDIVNMFTRYW
jgi:hypothetical protein